MSNNNIGRNGHNYGVDADACAHDEAIRDRQETRHEARVAEALKALKADGWSHEVLAETDCNVITGAFATTIGCGEDNGVGTLTLRTPSDPENQETLHVEQAHDADTDDYETETEVDGLAEAIERLNSYVEADDEPSEAQVLREEQHMLHEHLRGQLDDELHEAGLSYNRSTETAPTQDEVVTTYRTERGDTVELTSSYGSTRTSILVLLADDELPDGACRYGWRNADTPAQAAALIRQDVYERSHADCVA